MWLSLRDSNKRQELYLPTLVVILLVIPMLHLLELTGLFGPLSESLTPLLFMARLTLSMAAGVLGGMLVLAAVPAFFPSRDAEELRILHAEYPPKERRVQFNRLYIRMRWSALAGLVLLAGVARWKMGSWHDSAVWTLAFLAIAVGAANTAFSRLSSHSARVAAVAELQIAFDLLVLALVVHTIGGVESPLMFAFTITAIMAGVLLDRIRCFVTALVAWITCVAIALGEMSGTLVHSPFHLLVGAGDGAHVATSPGYVFSMLLFHFFVLLLITYFTTGIMDRLRTEERHGLAVRQRSDLIMQTTGTGFAIWDREGVLDWLNPQMKIWLGASPDSLPSEILGVEQWSGGRDGAVEQTYRDGRTRSEERQRLSPGSEVRFYHVVTSPVVDAMGQIYEVVEIVQDITEHKRQVSEMARSAQLAALGVMAAGFAHEIGNPLASISTRLRLLEEERGESFLTESIGVLQRQVSRMTQIVRGFAGYARVPAQERTACEANALVMETVNLLRFHERHRQCAVGTDLAPVLPAVYAGAGQLQQVFVNLGLNALEAMPDGGTLSIRTFGNENEVCIEFRDTGKGMSPAEREKVFSAFYSTKPGGLGLGLTIASSIVSSHEGRIEFRDNPHGGTLCTVVLPAMTRVTEATCPTEGVAS